MMRKKKKSTSAIDDTKIKVQLDYRTIITLHSMKALEMWRKRYPDAKVID